MPEAAIRRQRIQTPCGAWRATSTPGVATADADGGPWLVPLSFVWDGERLLLSTTGSSPTGRNLAAGGAIRIGIGETRDVVLVEGTVDGTVDGVTGIAPADLPASIGNVRRHDRLRPAHAGPRGATTGVRPVRVLAWRRRTSSRRGARARRPLARGLSGGAGRRGYARFRRARKAATLVRLAQALPQNRRDRFFDTSTSTSRQSSAAQTRIRLELVRPDHVDDRHRRLDRHPVGQRRLRRRGVQVVVQRSCRRGRAGLRRRGAGR